MNSDDALLSAESKRVAEPSLACVSHSEGSQMREEQSGARAAHVIWPGALPVFVQSVPPALRCVVQDQALCDLIGLTAITAGDERTMQLLQGACTTALFDHGVHSSQGDTAEIHVASSSHTDMVRLAQQRRQLRRHIESLRAARKQVQRLLRKYASLYVDVHQSAAACAAAMSFVKNLLADGTLSGERCAQ